MNLSIIKVGYSADYASDLANIDKQCFSKDAWSKTDWVKYWKSTTSVYFLQEDGKNIGSMVWDFNSVSGIGYLVSIAILPRYQKLGLGKKLMEHAMKEAKKLSIDTIFAHTRCTNYASQKLLKAFKFIANSYVDKYYQDESAIEWKFINQ